MAKITTTIFINNETSNPIYVECLIEATHEGAAGWEWSIEEIKSVQLVIGDKEGIDITKQVLSNPRAKALIISQVGSEDEQIIDALTESEDENQLTDQMREAI